MKKEHDFSMEKAYCWNGCPYYAEDEEGPGSCNQCNISLIDSNYKNHEDSYMSGWSSVIELLYNSQIHRDSLKKCYHYKKLQTYQKLKQI